MTMITRYFETKDQYLNFQQAWKNAINSGVHLTSAHFILYNLIRGKDPQTGFTPFQRMSKITGMGIINLGVYQAVRALISLRNPYNTNYMENQIEVFLAPFAGTFTRDDLEQLIIKNIAVLDSVQPITPTFGKGITLLRHLQNGDQKFNSCIELMDFYNSLDKHQEVEAA